MRLHDEGLLVLLLYLRLPHILLLNINWILVIGEVFIDPSLPFLFEALLVSNNAFLLLVLSRLELALSVFLKLGLGLHECEE